MRTEVIKIEVKTEDATQNVDKLNKEIKGTSENVKEVNEGIADSGGTIDKITGGAVTKFNAMKGSVLGVAKGFKSLKIAIIGSGVGLLLIAITGVVAAFKNSEEGQNKFARLMGQIGVVIGNVVDLLADFGDIIINAFENPKQAIKDFGDFLTSQITNRVKGLLELIPNLGKAFSKAMKGDFKGAGKIAVDSLGKIALGVEDVSGKYDTLVEKSKEFAKEQAKEIKLAGDVADMRAKADKIDRDLLVERGRLESEIAELRLKARQEDEFGFEERKQFLLESQVLQDELLDKEIKSAQLRADAQSLENTFARSNKQNLDDEARLKAGVFDIETKRLNTQRTVQRELNTLTNQIVAQENVKKKAEQDRIQSIEDYQQEIENKRLDIEAETHTQKMELERERAIEKLDLLQATEEQRASIIKFYDDQIIKAQEKDAEIKKSIDNKVNDEKKNGTLNVLEAVGGAMSRNGDFGKGMAAVQSVRDTYAGMTKALAQGGIFGYVGAAAIGVSGFANVRKILATQTPKAPTKSSGGGSISIPSAPSVTPPSFNIVGQGGSNQISDTINSQGTPIVKAVVVASEVTTGQAADRNRIDDSKF